MANGRPKGYMDWTPQPHVARIVQQVLTILEEYGSYGPMTVRQVFYRLVGNYNYDKTELAYKRLCEYLVKARRAHYIPFDAIRDDGTIELEHLSFDTRSSFLRWVGGARKKWFELDRQEGQPQFIELWCEAGGMAPMLQQITKPWHVPVYSTGGFSSVTVNHEVAMRIADRDRPTVMLHIGDYDPSGESIFTSMSQDIGKFVVESHGGTWNHETGETINLKGFDDEAEQPRFLPRRIALTEEQVATYDLPTAPPKASDSRSRNWIGETTQAEALPPDLLAEIVTAAIEDLIESEAYEAVEDREERDTDILGDRLIVAMDDIINDIGEVE